MNSLLSPERRIHSHKSTSWWKRTGVPSHLLQNERKGSEEYLGLKDRYLPRKEGLSIVIENMTTFPLNYNFEIMRLSDGDIGKRITVLY